VEVIAVATVARPELRAHDQAVRLPFPALVAELRDILGVRLVAYVGSVKETRAVNEWSEGTRAPGVRTRQRLRESYVVASMLAQADPPEVVRAWFEGLNPLLDDRSPARLMREGKVDDVAPLVLAAARAFLANG
jgi:hypothetical protein